MANGKPPLPAGAKRSQSGPRPVAAQPDADAATVDYEPGLVVALKYRLIRRVGEGGMAAVWVAHSEALDIDVAIKFIRGDVKHPHLGGRLLQEARAAARLGHPAIVRVFDFGTTDRGDPFIVMELLNGDDLGTALKHRGRLSAVKAVRTLLPIAHALATAHEKGIVHRDLKPENIILAQTEDGGIQPKLVDFGVAKLDHAGFERLTDLGTAIGSPGYMSPEQARGLDVDQRTDIWSLSVAIYETVTGRLPFDGKSYNALLRSIIEDTPPPITNFAAGDSALWEILKKGLTKRAEERWQSTRELGQALARWLIERGCSDDIAGTSLQAAWIAWRPRNTMPPSARGSFASIAPTDSVPPASKSAGADSTAKTAAVKPSNDPAARASDLAHTPPAGAEPYIPASERISIADDSLAPPASKNRGRIVFGAIVLVLLIGAGFAVVGQLSKKAAEPSAPPQVAATVPTERVEIPAPPKPAAPAATAEPTATEPVEAPSAAPSAEPKTKAEDRKTKPSSAPKPEAKPSDTGGKLEIKTTF